MVYYRWDEEKNRKLKKERDISFEEIVHALNQGKLIQVIKNPSSNFIHQKCYVLEMKDYVYLVPYVEHGDKKFLKTAYPSRKYKKIYLNKKLNNEN